MITENSLKNLKKFSSTNQPKKNGRPKGRTATDWLRVLSHTNISFHNPLTNKKDIGPVNLVVAIQLILKATQDSDLPSIREYLDRLDGKVLQEFKGDNLGGLRIILIKDNDKRVENIDEAIPAEVSVQRKEIPLS